MQPSTLQPPSSRPNRRGGRRPGAGAPRGNLNALKHGDNSRQIEQLALALSLVPEARVALARLARRQRNQQARARTVAVTILTNLLRTGLQALQTASDSLPNNRRESLSVTLVPNTKRPVRSSKSRDINQAPQPNSRFQSNAP